MGFSLETKDLIRGSCAGVCHLCDKRGTEVHHRVADTKSHRALFPLFLDSVFNGALLDRNCHDNRKHELDFLPGVVMSYEIYLAKYATFWYNLGREESVNGKTYYKNKISVQELREREDLSAITAKILS